MYTLYYVKEKGRKKNYIVQCGSKETLEKDLQLYKKQIGVNHKYIIEKDK